MADDAMNNEPAVIEWECSEGFFEGDWDHEARTGKFRYVIRERVGDDALPARVALTVRALDPNDAGDLNLYMSSVPAAKWWCDTNEESGGAFFNRSRHG